MQVGLHCRELSADCPLDVAGFSFSGVPGVIIGHNADIAWGFTNLGPDVSDLYLERVVGDQWRHDGRLLPLPHPQRDDRGPRRRRRAADRPLDRPRARCCPTSPTTSPTSASRRLSTTPTRRDEPYAVSLAWTALQPTATADAMLALNTATDWSSFREAASQFAVPAQNMVYADREGHIGYQAPGLIPIRQSGNDGYLPAEGWRADDDWTGDYVPFKGLPSVLDPEQGFVVTANQAVTDPDYPFHLTDDWDRGYRAQRIREVLEEEGELSVTEMAELQLDDRSPLAPLAGRPTSSSSRGRRRLLRRRPGAAVARGTTPSPPTARQRRTSTSCGATSSRWPSTTTCPRRSGRTAASAGWR